MKKTQFMAAAFASLLAGSAFAAPQTYSFDPQHTFPHFSYDHLGMTTQALRFNTMTGTITLDKEAKTAQVEAVIDMKSVDTGFEKFDTGIQAPDFLDTAQFPTATFKSTKVTFEGDKPVSIDGNLTIKGVTKPVTLTVKSYVNKMHPMLKKDTVGAMAGGVIKRSEFNAGKFVPLIGDDVTLNIVIEALQQ